MAWQIGNVNTADEVVDILNRANTDHNARISGIWKVTHAEFYLLFQSHPRRRLPYWEWNFSTTPEDVLDFLNRYELEEVQIVTMWDGARILGFYIFYLRVHIGTNLIPRRGAWKVKLAKSSSDAIEFLNGTGNYAHPAKVARITSGGGNRFYIFSQRSSYAAPIKNWRYVKPISYSDIQDAVNRNYPYQTKGFQVSAMTNGVDIQFHLFTNVGTQIWVQRPLQNERFVHGEQVQLSGLVTCDRILKDDPITWSSNLNGQLGRGSNITTSILTVGTHAITAKAYGRIMSIPVRIFTHLGEFYSAAPSTPELARLTKDFSFQWVDGAAAGENWAAYPNIFDQTSTDPSKIAIKAKLEILRHQSFSEQLPFTDGRTIYDYFATFVNNMFLRLDCGFNSAGGDHVSLNRSLSVWDGRRAGSAADPDACKQAFVPNPPLYPYINPLYLLIHECRHNEPTDPGHILSPDGIQQDPTFEDGSGHSRAAMYAMWIYKYSKFDPQEMKDQAKEIAKMLLTDRFPGRPTHSNPLVQAVIDEILGP